MVELGLGVVLQELVGLVVEVEGTEVEVVHLVVELDVDGEVVEVEP